MDSVIARATCLWSGRIDAGFRDSYWLLHDTSFRDLLERPDFEAVASRLAAQVETMRLRVAEPVPTHQMRS